MHKIGENIKKARVQAGLTQKEVEERLGFRELMMKDFETERLKLSAETALDLAKLYKVNIEELLCSVKEEKVDTQRKRLGHLYPLFHQHEVKNFLKDPVISAWMEEHREGSENLSNIEILTLELNSKEAKEVMTEILKCLGSLMGIDEKITEEEMSFFNELVELLGMQSHLKTLARNFTTKHIPHSAYFHQRSAIKHFLLWVMFYLSKSDGNPSFKEIEYIEECAEVLKISRSNFIFIKEHFIKGKY